MSVQLYELPRGATFRVVPGTALRRPPCDESPVDEGEVLTNRGLDGMYCKVDTTRGERIYLVAWTPVERVP
jgi:hypothetical protein